MDVPAAPATSPFVLNAWYAIGWETDIGRSLKPFTVCGVPLLAYRRFDRTIAAIADACWHRGLPLSMGRLVGDEVECAYHGLRFAPEGRCTFVPGQEVIPASACVRAFPVVERHRLVWAWLGPAELADPALVPDLHWADDSAWSCEGNSIEIACDYRLLLDNLMDLTHETYVHGSSIGHSAILDAPFEVAHDDAGVTLSRWMANVTAPPFLDMQLRLAHGVPAGIAVDRWQVIRFEAPSTVEIDVGVAPAGTGAPQGDRSRGISGRVLNAITPKTETSCYYHFAFARNFRLDSRELDEEIKAGVTRIFGEDKVILEAQQQALNRDPTLRLRDLKIDSGSVRMRRLIERKLAMEWELAASQKAAAE
jgi:phenylpropionate dioxygenase-like ring-hydroxylating dioxygenase large terminal subunit